jgi:hypothetical protein
MKASRDSLRQAACALALGCAGLIVPVEAAPVLRSADVSIRIESPSSCDVTMTLVVDGGTPIDHRLEAPPGTEVDDVHYERARATSEPQTIGSTRSLQLTPEQGAYMVSYRVRQQAGRMHRCPLWLPVAPADGVSRAVKLRAELPAGAAPGSTMPRFTWNGTTGIATLGHLPAFVLIPYSASGEPASWDVSTVMDAAAVSVFACASAIWAWRKRTTRRPESTRTR